MLALTGGMWLVGQSQIIGLKQDANLAIFGLSLIGLALTMASIPIVPECQELMFTDTKAHNTLAQKSISRVILFSTGIGETMGPIVSTQLALTNSFQKSLDLYASFLLSFILLFFFLGGGLSIFAYSKKESERVVGLHVPMREEVEIA